MYNLVSEINKDSLPYFHKENKERLWKPTDLRVHDSILDFVGNTPIIKLNRIPKDHGLCCEIYAKCEFMNPAGSIKDRIGMSMFEDALQQGVLQPDSVLVEPTSGNTGIGIAFNAALRGNKCIVVTEEKNAGEKLNSIRLFGAEVIQLLDGSPEIATAQQIKDRNPDSTIMLDQFENDVNPKTHYDHTGFEIVEAMKGDIDMVVMCAGTGGTITGVGHRVKKECPNCIVTIGEPDGSTMFNTQGKRHPFLVEGIGGSTPPITTDPGIVDHMEVVNDQEAFLMAREIVRKEGLLCGGSSGTAMAAAVKTAKKLNLGVGKRIVVILPDGIRNYMSKFVTDQWMEAHFFQDPPEHTMKWWKQPVTKLRLHHKYPLIDSTSTCKQAVKKMSNGNAAIIVNKKGWFVGAVTKDSLRKAATHPTKLPDSDSEELNFNEVVTNRLVKHCYTLPKNGKKGVPSLGLLSRMLDITPFVVIGKEHCDSDTDYFVPEGVATGDDVLDYIFQFQN